MSKISWKLFFSLGVVIGALVISYAVYAISENVQEKGHHQKEGEESGEKLSPTETYDHVHKGVRLVLAFHNASSSFIGSMENVTDKKIKSVRVEVHLSDGPKLGPTEPIDLTPGEKAGIKLETAGQPFTWWKALIEVGSSERGISR